MSEPDKSSNDRTLKFTSLVAIPACIALVASAVAAWSSSCAAWSSAHTAKLSYELARKLGEASHIPEMTILFPDTFHNENENFPLTVDIKNVGQNQFFIKGIYYAMGTFSEKNLLSMEKMKLDPSEIDKNIILQAKDRFSDIVKIQEDKKWPLSGKIQLTVRVIVQNDIGQMFIRNRCDYYLKQPDGSYKGHGLCSYLNSISMDEKTPNL